MIVSLIEAGGVVEGPHQTRPSRRSTTPARRKSLSARWPKATPRRARRVATPKRSARSAEIPVPLESSGEDQGTDIVPSHGSESEDTNSERDDPDRELRRQGSPETTEATSEHSDEAATGDPQRSLTRRRALNSKGRSTSIEQQKPKGMNREETTQAPGARDKETWAQDPGMISSTGRSGHAMWEKTEGTSINVRTDWSVCNQPDSVGWSLCPPQLLNALVISVVEDRGILEMARRAIM
jgi:hypothetical protein